MPLDEYKKKRDFTITSEPDISSGNTSNEKIFVVQRHDARQLHYDFRLEMEGVLKSWAVPKGPSLNPSDKRLAVMVEDHPYDYHSFEGDIPKGNYGAGNVKIWDSGTYEPLHREEGKSDEEVLLEGLNKGSMKIIMHGKKLKGEFALVKILGAEEENNWLLIKHKDKYSVNETYNADDFSPLKSKKSKSSSLGLKTSSSSLKSFNSGISNTAISNTKSLYTKSSASKLSTSKPAISKLTKSDYIKPMLASKVGKPFNDDEWIFEIKWDGYRAIADLTDGVMLYSRNGISFLGKYPDIETALESQAYKMILDGEIVAYNDEDKPDFQILQHYEDHKDTLIIYNVFDLLYLNGHNTRELSLLQRKELLKDALIETPNIKYCDYIENKGVEFYNEILKMELEGIMAKKKNSIYIDGVRTTEWLKIKNQQTEEAIIVGFTEPKGSRKYFGSLILGKYVDGQLTYAGHVGTGFSEKTLKEIYEVLKPLINDEIPFSKKPLTNMPPTWVKPSIICTIKFTEITDDGLFRHPVFIGLRQDLNVEELKNEGKRNMKSSNPINIDNKTEKTEKTEKIKVDKTSSSIMIKNSDKVFKSDKTASEIDVVFTNTDKLYWKKEKISKGDLIDYYLSVSDYILPHLKDRAQSLHRFPDGIDGPDFYHKDAGQNAPSWVETVTVFSESNNKNIEYIVCNNKETLGYLINLGCIELNPWNNRVDVPGKPDYLIIDLDPSDKNTFKQVIETAKVVKEFLDICEVPAYCKTSGSTGIHIFVPMGVKYSYDQVKDFAFILMQLVQKRLPKTTTLERSLSKRGPKIYLDYLQNRHGQTVSCVYSVRPKPGATVSMAIEWSELTNDLSIKDFTIQNVLKRIQKNGDIFLPVLKEQIDMNQALEKLQASE